MLCANRQLDLQPISAAIARSSVGSIRSNPGNFIEGAIGGEDCIDPTVDRECCDDRIARVDIRVGLVEVDPTLNIVRLEGMALGELGNVSRRFCRTEAVSGAARPVVQKLLE